MRLPLALLINCVSPSQAQSCVAAFDMVALNFPEQDPRRSQTAATAHTQGKIERLVTEAARRRLRFFLSADDQARCSLLPTEMFVFLSAPGHAGRFAEIHRHRGG